MIDRKQIPPGWEVVKLGALVSNPKKDLVDGPFGSNLRANEYTDKGIPVFKIQNIKANRFIDKNINYITEEKAKTLARHSFAAGDLIITKLGEPLGLCCKVPQKYPYGIIVADLMRLRPNKTVVLDKFLIFSINSNIVQNQFKLITKGTTRPRVNLTIVRELEIPLPPLLEQHRIVSKIEELFSELDKGIESLKTAQQQLKIYRQAVLKWAFEGRLTNKDVNWINTTLGEIISISSGDGLTKASRKDDGEYLVYGGNGVAGKHNAYMYEEEKLIIGRVGVHCGNAHITKPKSWITDNAFVVSFDENNIGIKFLYHFIWYLNLNKYSSSTAQPVISQAKIYPIEISIPEKKEVQTKIVQEIETRLSVCDKLGETITTALQQSEALRQSILKKAFEGKLVEQDPKDEPASKLLERIKAEKAAVQQNIYRKGEPSTKQSSVGAK